MKVFPHNYSVWFSSHFSRFFSILLVFSSSESNEAGREFQNVANMLRMYERWCTLCDWTLLPLREHHGRANPHFRGILAKRKTTRFRRKKNGRNWVCKVKFVKIGNLRYLVFLMVGCKNIREGDRKCSEVSFAVFGVNFSHFLMNIELDFWFWISEIYLSTHITCNFKVSKFLFFKAKIQI